MRITRFLSALLVLVLCSFSYADRASGEEQPNGNKEGSTIWLGGWGHFSPGFFAGQVLNLGAQLEKPELLGPGAAPGSMAWSLGGGGKIYVAGVLLGGKGYTYVVPETSTDRGGAAVTGGGGGFDIGYAILRQRHVLLYPFIGIGGAGVDLEISNHSKQELQFGEGDPIAPGEKQRYTAGFMTFDLGLGVQTILHQYEGGLILGAEVGYITTTAGTSWTDQNEKEIEGVDAAAYSGAYFRLTIGGGGFFLE